MERTVTIDVEITSVDYFDRFEETKKLALHCDEVVNGSSTRRWTEYFTQDRRGLLAVTAYINSLRRNCHEVLVEVTF